MAISTKERGEYTLLHMVNRMVWEARRNDELGKVNTGNSDLFSSTEKLLGNLTRQAPNRIYFGPEGIVCRVLFFNEKGFSFQARIETLRMLPEPEVVKSESIATSTLSDLEREIMWWRRQFGMRGDLLADPYRVLERIDSPGEFVHIGKISGKSSANNSYPGTVNCRYHQTNLNGPRFSDLGLNKVYRVRRQETFRVIDNIPQLISRHMYPFNNFIPTP